MFITNKTNSVGFCCTSISNNIYVFVIVLRSVCPVVRTVNYSIYIDHTKLLNNSGHVGYGIRLSERQKGYGTRLLAQSLEKLKELGTKKALIVCDEGMIVIVH